MLLEVLVQQSIVSVVYFYSILIPEVVVMCKYLPVYFAQRITSSFLVDTIANLDKTGNNAVI